MQSNTALKGEPPLSLDDLLPSAHSPPLPVLCLPALSLTRELLLHCCTAHQARNTIFQAGLQDAQARPESPESSPVCKQKDIAPFELRGDMKTLMQQNARLVEQCGQMMEECRRLADAAPRARPPYESAIALIASSV
jgi:hypothetical protein